LHTRHAARLLLYERDAAAAAIVQSVELGSVRVRVNPRG